MELCQLDKALTGAPHNDATGFLYQVSKDWPKAVTRREWEGDYKNIVASMVMGDAPSFYRIMTNLEIISMRIN